MASAAFVLSWGACCRPTNASKSCKKSGGARHRCRCGSTMRASIRVLTFHDLRGTAVVTLARAGCNEVEIYSITGHKPSDVRAILTVHYLPQDMEVAGNAIAKLNQYKTRRDQTEDRILPTALPTALKFVPLKPEKG